MGSTPEDSPFFKVLNHIKKAGQNVGLRWRLYPFLWSLSLFFLTAAISCYLVPTVFANCVPFFDGCAAHVPSKEGSDIDIPPAHQKMGGGGRRPPSLSVQ